MRYIVKLYGDAGGHRTWGVYRAYDNALVCVCVYKKGAVRACAELNALAEGKMGYIEPEKEIGGLLWKC